MRVHDVSHITQRMVFLRLYEILVEANQSVVDRRDFQTLQFEDAAQTSALQSNWQQYNAGYPFCYFTGECLDDLLQQPIIWQEQHLTMEAALWQAQPDLDHWLTQDIRQLLVDDFFAWQPHTVKVQELVDDVKQRVLDVVDAVHMVEKVQSGHLKPRLLRINLEHLSTKKIITGAVAHSISYRFNGIYFEPILYDGAHRVNQKWCMHSLIHGMWLASQFDAHVSVDAADSSFMLV